MSKLEKRNRRLKAMQKEHNQSKIIQNLNREITYHDKLIEILRSIHADKEESDNAVLDALMEKRKPEEAFKLREDLLEDIKKMKRKLHSTEKRYER